jgi:hypothetical protein
MESRSATHQLARAVKLGRLAGKPENPPVAAIFFSPGAHVSASNRAETEVKGMTAIATVVMFAHLAAADITGAWTVEMNDFSGNPTTFDCTFTQEGTKLTGVCAEGQPRPVKITGTVKDRQVDFQHQTGKNDDITAYYSGDLNDAARTLRGKWRVVNPDNGKTMTDVFTAVRR